MERVNTPYRERKKTGTSAFISPVILSQVLFHFATLIKSTPMQQAAFMRGGQRSPHPTRQQTNRTAISEKHNKQWIPPPMCTLHWVGKLTPKLSNVHQLQECLTMVVGDADTTVSNTISWQTASPCSAHFRTTALVRVLAPHRGGAPQPYFLLTSKWRGHAQRLPCFTRLNLCAA